MSEKEQGIEVKGKVLEIIRGGKFKIEITPEHIVIAHPSGKVRVNAIKIIPGDTVKVELSPYDLTKGRIMFREK